MEYAIVDIETTGSYAAANGITEISIHIHNGEQVIEVYETLINPLQSIPRFIQALTNITDEMVAHAPTFEEVAPIIYEKLRGRVFVAHSVNFDYSFVKAQLAYCGFELNEKKLCTVRLSRKIIPGLQSYSLGKLCHALDIPNTARHRAGGDAEATAILFSILLQKDTEQVISKSLQRNSKESILPPHVPREQFQNLPYSPGVYYFHNEKGKIIYVGKAKNIKYRVNSHFSNNSSSRQKQNFVKHTHSISFKECATELMAAIFESTEIKRLWPIFNYSQKKQENNLAIISYYDQNGYLRLGLEKYRRSINPVCSVPNKLEGQSLLKKMMTAYNLCAVLCFIQKEIPCEHVELGSCYGACENKELPVHYNKRVKEAITFLKQKPQYAIVEKGLHDDEQSCILVTQEQFAMGYVPVHISIENVDVLLDYLEPIKENNVMRNMIALHAMRHPEQVVYL